MSAKNRQRRLDGARRRQALGLDRAQLPRRSRRRLEREMSSAPLLHEVREDIAQFSGVALLDLLTNSTHLDATQFLTARLVSEVVRAATDGQILPTPSDLKRLMAALLQVVDPVLIAKLGGDFAEHAITRTLAPQLHVQRNFVADFARVIGVLGDPDPRSPVGPNEWLELLGIRLEHYLLATMILANRLSAGPCDLAAYLALDPESSANKWVRTTADLLSGDYLALRKSGRANSAGDQLYELGPLLRTPIYRRSDGRLAAPAIDYVRLAASPPALYIRLIRADSASKNRNRSAAVGGRFKQYLFDYAVQSAAAGWQVRDLDQEPPSGDGLADIAIWPEDGSFLLIVEAKTSLQLFPAQLGDENKKARTVGLYQSAFNQIRATVASMGKNQFLSDAPTDVPVFGLAVTFDLHLTTVINGSSCMGIVLDYRLPDGPKASSSTASRVLECADFENIADTLAWARPAQVQRVLEHIFHEKSPARTAGKSIRATIDKLPADLPLNPLTVKAFDQVASSIEEEDAVLAEQLRAIASRSFG